MLADISSYGIALIAVQASMDPTFTGSGAGPFDCGQTEAARQRLASKSTFGLHRVEVLGSLGSILIIWLAAGVLLYEGASRIVMTLHISPYISTYLHIISIVSPHISRRLAHRHDADCRPRHGQRRRRCDGA